MYPDLIDPRHAIPETRPPGFHPNKLNRFFFSGLADKPHAVLVICLITREIGESLRASGVAVFWASRAVAKSLGIFHWAGMVRAFVMLSSSIPSERGVYRLSTISSRLPLTVSNSEISRLELSSSVMP